MQKIITSWAVKKFSIYYEILAEYFASCKFIDDWYIQEANLDLTNWLVKYNSYRPHEALDYKTPLEYAYENFFQVLPMWPARTATSLFQEFLLK